MAEGYVNALHYVQDTLVLVDLTAFLGPAIFPPLLGETEKELYRCHHSSIRIHQQKAVPHISTYNFWILPVDGTATSASHLKTIQLQQAHGYNLKASVRAIMAHKASGRLCHFHTNTNNYHLLPILACVKGLEDFHLMWELVDQGAWMDHVASLMLDSAWHIICLTMSSTACIMSWPIIGLSNQPGIRNQGIRACELRCLGLPQHPNIMEQFPGLTMDELGFVKTMFSTGFRVYTLDDCRS